MALLLLFVCRERWGCRFLRGEQRSEVGRGSESAVDCTAERALDLGEASIKRISEAGVECFHRGAELRASLLLLIAQLSDLSGVLGQLRHVHWI